MTTFATQTGANGLSVESITPKISYFGLHTGFGGASTENTNTTYFALQTGFNGVSVELSSLIYLLIVDEANAPFLGTVTITVKYGAEQYTDSFNCPDQYLLAVFTDDNGNTVEQQITITDGTLTRTYTIIPTLGSILTLALTRVPINAISLVDAIGNIDSILQVENAVLTDSTAWDGDSPKSISFPVSGGVSDEPFFYFAREEGHLRLTADVTYEVVPGRPITETFTNIAIAP